MRRRRPSSSPRRSRPHPRPGRGRPPGSPRSARGRRFTAEQHEKALGLVAAKVKRAEIARVLGCTCESVRRWTRKAEREGRMPAAPTPPAKAEARGQPTPSAAPTGGRSVYAPQDPGQGLSEPEVAAILELKREHPSYGPAQLRAQLKRFKGWRLANRAIARVLRQHGYQLVHRGSRPEGPEPTRFEAPRRNAIWQADFTELRVGEQKLALLVIVDDFSRFVVGHRLCETPSSEAALSVFRAAIARHGKPESVRTDRGGAFTGGEFSKALDNELIDHIVGHSYHPQGGGKVEAVIGTVKRELWDVEHFASRAEAERRLVEFFAEYNERRAHMGIDGLTPADRFFGRADRVLADIDARSRRRNAAQAVSAHPGAPSEDGAGGPLEVLRLVVIEGQMELRLLGARVQLGPVQP